jgi:DNA-binding transcriptional LysR family regulator
MHKTNNARPDAFFQQFRHWDLNLLVVLDALFTEDGNVTRAAQRVGLSQSALSHALNRLRDMLGDALFVKQGNRMQATARTRDLAPLVSLWLEQIRECLNPPLFDPASVESEINVAIPEHLERLVLPALLRHFVHEAPNLHFHSRPVPIAQLAEAFSQGRIDMAIIGNDWDSGEGYLQQTLAYSRFMYVYHPAMLALPEPASLAMLASVPQLASNYSHKTATIIDNHFTAHGLKRRITATSGGITATPAILAASPMLTILPEIMITGNPLFNGFKMFPFEPDDVRVSLHLVWHRLHEHDPVHRYVREWIIRHFAGMDMHEPKT